MAYINGNEILFSPRVNINGEGNESVVTDATPFFVIEEAEATIAKVLSRRNLGRTIRFIALSDTHEDSEKAYNSQITISNKHAGQAIKYIADRIGLDFIAHLGDVSSAGAFVTTYNFDTLCNDVKQIRQQVFSGVSGTKRVLLVGNHDQFYCTDGTRLFNSGAFTLFGSVCSGVKDRIGGYGYFDIDDAKVRVIYLNTSDIPSSTVAGTYIGVSQLQKNWLCDTLIDTNTKDDADEWKIMLLSHVPLDFGGANISSDILLPYVNGGSYNGYNFNSKNSAEIISNIHGHVHCFSYGYINDKIRRFAIPNACFVGNNHYANRAGYEAWVDTTTYNKTANSGKDTAFSLVTIDIDSGKCYVDNYGAGIDRVFSVTYKPEVEIVPTGISNISYSGTTTHGDALDKTKFTFTVTYNNGTSNSVTGATSISHSIISNVGDNTVTITYTENGTSVTSNAVIVGTEKPNDPVTIIPKSISNIQYTGTTIVGEQIDKSKLTFTVNYSDGTTINKSASSAGVIITPTTISNVGNNTFTIIYVESTGQTQGEVVIVGTEETYEPEPTVNLLNLNRTYVSGTVGENIANVFDENVAYLNVVTDGSFISMSYTVSDVSENSVTVTEPKYGGLYVAYPVMVAGARSVKLAFDYSGTGKCRVYKWLIDSSTGGLINGGWLYNSDTEGESGSKTVEFSTQNGCDLILYFGANTANTKTYTNVSLTKIS